jgi:ABC-2 type transport system ATP-binding protein
LAEALAGPGVTVSATDHETLEVTGLSTAEVGDQARDLDVSLHGLAPKKASLEEAFMEMTRDEVEYHAIPPTTPTSPTTRTLRRAS